ncbi:nuclear transport factor 2 family protein [Leucobacter viscericola]|uniref:Nuclear transport factor 2 family protein n=1 Tax=Leucobacter viscericola TaxID=2714935 RepID=A0A6G7XF53_9MICO|nr:nuclear transport factor 2 family protein [Leucobacter viscericola]QIK63224.1 nuclear transport factor 2 family protein [Leucobacter viscericola]
MYKRIVRARLRDTFDRINEGDYMTMVDGLADSFEYRFHGQHALGGRRTSRASMLLWWQRVFRLLPGMHFAVQDVLVNGGPRRTRVAVRSLVSGALPGGQRYENTVFQFLTIAWGKVESVETIEDLRVLEHALRAVAESGNPEALADPIED